MSRNIKELAKALQKFAYANAGNGLGYVSAVWELSDYQSYVLENGNNLRELQAMLLEHGRELENWQG